MTTEYMLQLARSLTDVKKVTESTASAYIKTLAIMNDKKPFKNLAFLKKTDEIQKKIDEYAESTQRAILATIVSVLALENKKTFKKTHTYYFEKMMDKSKEHREEPKNEKSEKQKDNWISWEDIEKKKAELGTAVAELASQKSLTPSQYETLMRFVVVSIYTDVPPRRNQDYLDMFVVKKITDKTPKDKNYYDLSTHRFVFNKYKTSKTYGSQTVEVPPMLQTALATLIKHHPLYLASKKKAVEYKLLVGYDGKALTAVNVITRLLNKTFGKKVGSSMLRHIYLTDKYKNVLEEQKKDAEDMGHSTGEQKEYIVN